MFAEAQYSINKKAKRLIKSKLKSKGYKVKWVGLIVHSFSIVKGCELIG
jgi:hypothetical protein